PLALKVRATNNNGGCNISVVATQVCTTISCSKISFSLDSAATVCPGSNQHVFFSKFSTRHFGISLNGGKITKDSAYNFSFTQDSTLRYNIYDSAYLSCAPLEVVIPIRI